MISLTEKTDFIISRHGTKKKKIDGMLKYELQPSMSVVGVEKFTSAKEPAVTKTSFIICFSDFFLLVLKTMILWQLCTHLFQLVIYTKKPGCAGPNICLFK